MVNPFLVEYNGRPSSDYFQCCKCKTPVAFVEDYIAVDVEPGYVPQGILTKMFNVDVPNGEAYHEVKDDMTLTETYCLSCRDLLGWKFIIVPQGCDYEEGQFLMILHRLSYSNGQPLARNLAGGANERYLGANEGNADQDGGTNEENVDQGGGGNELFRDEQDGGTNEENADQGGGGNEQVPNGNGHY